ncbi:MAG: hypothetical protein R2911_21750 [Caldilineaceae bacterium]
MLTNYHVVEASAETNYMVGVQVPTSAVERIYTLLWVCFGSRCEPRSGGGANCGDSDWEPVEALTFAFALGDSDALELGEEVIAIGYPDISVLHLATTRQHRRFYGRPRLDSIGCGNLQWQQRRRS